MASGHSYQINTSIYILCLSHQETIDLLLSLKNYCLMVTELICIVILLWEILDGKYKESVENV